ncbi:MAG: hypothetical protein KDD47_18995 [Acidobacteria bacterium]|nr:hypothetical protein [Acidobacteriota bacterium]
MTATSRRNLAEALLGEDPGAARTELAAALAVFRRLEPEGWRVADGESLLGEVLWRLGDGEKAGPLLEGSYRRLQELRGDEVGVTRQALARLRSFRESADQDLDSTSYQAEAESSNP